MSRTPVNVTDSPHGSAGELGIERSQRHESRTRFLLSRGLRAGAVRAFFHNVTVAWTITREAHAAGVSVPVYLERELDALRVRMLMEQARRRVWLSEEALAEAVRDWMDQVHA